MAISFLAFWLGLDHEIYFAAITHTSPRADKPDTLDVPPRLSRRHKRSRPVLDQWSDAIREGGEDPGLRVRGHRNPQFQLNG
jgi:hypothetical protein